MPRQSLTPKCPLPHTRRKRHDLLVPQSQGAPSSLLLFLGAHPTAPRSWGKAGEEAQLPRRLPAACPRCRAAARSPPGCQRPPWPQSRPGRGGHGPAQAPLGPRLMQPGAAAPAWPQRELGDVAERAVWGCPRPPWGGASEGGPSRGAVAGRSPCSVRAHEGAEPGLALAQPRSAHCRGKNHRINWNRSPRSAGPTCDRTPRCQVDHGAKCHVQSLLEHRQGQ